MQDAPTRSASTSSACGARRATCALSSTPTFLVVIGGRLVTPPLDEHILDSITRRRVLEAVEVREAPITVDDLRTASGAALASTTREVQPIHHIEDIELDVNDALIREAAERNSEAIASAL